MSYPLAIPIYFDEQGLTLTGQFQDDTGTNSGGAVTTGFTSKEWKDAGNVTHYGWEGRFQTAHDGGYNRPRLRTRSERRRQPNRL